VLRLRRWKRASFAHISRDGAGRRSGLASSILWWGDHNGDVHRGLLMKPYLADCNQSVAPTLQEHPKSDSKPASAACWLCVNNARSPAPTTPAPRWSAQAHASLPRCLIVQVRFPWVSTSGRFRSMRESAPAPRNLRNAIFRQMRERFAELRVLPCVLQSRALRLRGARPWPVRRDHGSQGVRRATPMPHFALSLLQCSLAAAPLGSAGR
jgi:hypothetical protein